MDDEARWRLLFIKKMEAGIVDSFRLFRENGVEPILVKGWAAARNYPEHIQRIYGDIDLAVPATDFERMRKLLKSGVGNKLDIDLHCEFRHLDTRPWSEIISDSQEIDLNGAAIRIPSDEDHLRILAVHWLNDGGARKDRLRDIYYAVQNRPANFDWDRCLNSVSEIRRKWTVAAIGLAHKYLDLEIDGLPFAKEAKDLPPWLVSAVEKEWRSGGPLKSLHICLNDPKELFKQIRKRIPPNAIQATIEMEGSFNDKSRLSFQIGSLVRRLRPSIRGIRATLRPKQ